MYLIYETSIEIIMNIKRLSIPIITFITIYGVGVLHYYMSTPAKASYSTIFAAMLNRHLQSIDQNSLRFIASPKCSDGDGFKCISVTDVVSPRLTCSPWAWKNCAELHIGTDMARDPLLTGNIFIAFSNICSNDKKYQKIYEKNERLIIGCERHALTLTEFSVRFTSPDTKIIFQLK